jgi:dTDP-4-amino-4,6-dideoxygalactose transaminase
MLAYADARYKAGDFPVAEACARSVLSLPLHSHMTGEQVEQVATQIYRLAGKRRQETVVSSR